MNRVTFLKTLLISSAPISASSLDIGDILGNDYQKDQPKDAKAIPEWPFQTIQLTPIQKIVWEDYHSNPYNIFVRKSSAEKVMAQKISEIYIGEFEDLTPKIKFSSKMGEVLIDELDFNNNPVDDPIWEGLFEDEFPKGLKKVTIFTAIGVYNHEFLQGLSDSGKFNVKIFSLERGPEILKENTRV